MDSFDYIIVGAGSAGCVLANRLSADPAVRVLLLEAGGSDDWLWMRVPIGSFYCLGNPRADWCYQSEPEPALGGRRIAVPRGRALGGSSSINGMAYLRGQAADYDHWASLGNPGWGWQDVLPFFKFSEDYAHGADALHGAGGELRVEEARAGWDVLDGFRDACVEAGIPRSADFNRGDNEGTGYVQLNQRRGARCSSAVAFLRPASARPNLRVETGAMALGVQLEGRRARGIDYWRDGVLRQAEVTGEVIVSAGAIASPQLLQVSGIGPGALLSGRGIAVRHDLPGVGENLQDHVTVRVVKKVKGAQTLNEAYHSAWGRVRMGMQYFLLRRGPLTIAAPPLAAFTRSDPSRPTPNLQYLVAPLSWERIGGPPHPFAAVTASVINLRPASRGRVGVNSADAREHPAILHNFLDDADDRRVALDGLRLVERIFAMPAMQRFAPSPWLPDRALESDQALLEFARANAGSVFHPVGTCRMGSDRLAVVDERLRVRGIGALRVVDASVMPCVTSGNTNAPTIMIGEKGAAMILEDRRRGGGGA